MKKIISIIVLCSAVLAANAVPARRGWQTQTQADGTTIEVQVIGDEFYHYTINRDGLRVRMNEQGNYEVVGEAPTSEEFAARRAKAQARRARQEIGVTPNLAPRGVVILANFADTKFKGAHTRAVFDEMCNSAECTVNTNNGVPYPSAAEYFSAQSNGQYRPQFDVFGPVTLSKGYAYYGEDVSEEGDDRYAATAVVEACLLANEQYEELDFKNYDSDGDGYVDFVYVIYAGKGQADGGNSNTIWPHNWEIESAIYYGSCTYKASQCRVDGKQLNSYAMSSELSGSVLGGIGTLCHEFGHVMGLPDFYDTNYKTNYQNMLTPNEWDVMDGGAYNGNGHCPPNYSPWEKYFFGWHTPVNLGTKGARLALEANGTTGYQAYQVNTSGKLQTATTEGLNYYFENRQQQGWDEYIPYSGLVIWKVNYNDSKWANNEPNNSANNPRYTIVCSSGTKIGGNYGEKNVFPYNNVKSWDGVSGKPLTDITRDGELIRLVYISEPTQYTVTWMVNGEVLETARYAADGSEDLRLPSIAVDACEGTELVGWTRDNIWFDPFELPEDLFTTPSGKVTQDCTYYAIFK